MAQIQNSSPTTWRGRFLADQIGLDRVPGDDDPWLDAADNHHRSAVGSIHSYFAVGNIRDNFSVGSEVCNPLAVSKI